MLARSQELAHLGSWELDHRSGRLTWSDEVYRIFGLEPQEFGATYEAFLEHVHPDDRAAVDAACSGSLHVNRDTYEIEHRVVRRHTGEIRYVLERCDHIRDEAGTIVCSVGMVHDITERKRAEEALGKSEGRYRAIVETAAEGIVMVRPGDGRYTYVNQRMADMLGYAPEEIVGKSTADLASDGWDQVALERRAQLPDAGSVTGLFKYRRKDGSALWSRYNAAAMFDQAGRHVANVSMHSDVTEQQLAEEALRASEERLLLAQSIAQVGTFEWDIQTGVNVWTPELEAMYGLPPGGFAGTQPAWEDLVHPEDRETAVRQVEEAFDSGEPVEGQWRAVWPDGSVHWLAGRFRVIKDDAGTPLRMTGVNIDITARMQAEEALRRSERQSRLEREHLKAVLEATPSAVVQVEASDGRFSYANRRANELYGLDYVGFDLQAHLAKVGALRPDGTPFPLDEMPASHALHGRQVHEVEMSIKRADGTRVSVSVSAAPLRDADGEVTAAIVVFDDISARKGIEEALRTAEQAARVSEARYRSIVELATEKLALDFGLEVQTDADVSSSAREAGDAHRRQGRLAEAILAQRRHARRTLLIALALEIAYLVPMGMASTRDILGIPGSLLALTVIIVAAIAGIWPGIVAALAGTAIFYVSVAARGVNASPLAILVSAGIWVAAAVLSSLVSAALVEQSLRRREAAVAFVQAETARREQSAELSSVQRLATALQESFVHPLPSIPDWDFGAATASARAFERVGGDFHDVFVTQRDCMGVLIGDVEGKGLEAAGLTETVRSAAHALAISAGVPYVLERLNEVLLRRDESLVTALLASVHRRSGVFIFASAGHPAPLLLHADGSVESLPVTPGLPLGAFDKLTFATSTGSLRHGEALLLYTDGATDARRAGRFFGEEGLLEVVRGCAGLNAQEVADRVLRAVTEYADELRDDIHVLVVRRLWDRSPEPGACPP